MSTDFSSLDKLVEFGLGVSVANQMMNTMNTVIARTAVPGAGINPGVVPVGLRNEAPELPVEKQFYIVGSDEKVAGPLSQEEMVTLVKRNAVTAKTFCWSPGMPSWQLAENIPEVNKLLILNS